MARRLFPGLQIDNIACLIAGTYFSLINERRAISTAARTISDLLIATPGPHMTILAVDYQHTTRPARTLTFQRNRMVSTDFRGVGASHDSRPHKP